MATSINKDLFTLTPEDFQDILDIIRVANCRLKLMEMRAKVVTSLKYAFQAKGVAFFLGDSNLGAIDNTNLVSIGLDRRYLKQYAQCYCYDDPFQQNLTSRETVCKVDSILPYSRWVNLKIYNEFYRPQNIHYKLSIHLHSRTGILGLIGIFRSKDSGDFSEREVAKARILAPYLTSVVEDINQTPRELLENSWFTEEALMVIYQLTKRETDVVSYVCQGLTNSEIGERLCISRFTVETHLKNVFSKTMIKHRAGLASLLRSN